MPKSPRRLSKSRSLRVQLLGRFSVYREGERVPDLTLGSLKGRTLLKLLAVRRGHLVAMDEIVETLWREEPPSRSEENVAVLVSRLRAVLGDGVVEGGRAGYLLRPGPGCSVDLDDAARLTAEAQAAEERGDEAAARTSSDAALALLGVGDLLEDEPVAEWAETERGSARRLARAARHLAARLALRRGDLDRARTLAEDLIGTESLDEEAHRLLIEALFRAGEQAKALAAYESLRRVLADELGTDPSRGTEAIYLAVLRGEELPDSHADRVAPRGPFGRVAEMSRLDAAWDEAFATGPVLAIVAGEAGIGKTTLCEAFADRVEAAGAVVLRARCYEMERSLVLQPLVDAVREAVLRPEGQPAVAAMSVERRAWLRELIPEIGIWTEERPARALSPEAQRQRWFDAAAALLAELCARRPIMLFLDDVHHAGETTLEFMHLLTRRRFAGPLLILGACRTEEVTSLASLLPRARRVEVTSLSGEAVRQIADGSGLGEWTDVLREVSGGHPLYVVELIRSLRESGGLAPTESLRQAISERVERAGKEVGKLLRAAAVVGPVFDLPLVATLIGRNASRCARLGEEALRRGLLREDGDRYVFAHGIVRETIHDSIPRPTRVAWHRQVATELQKRGERDELIGFHAALGLDHALAASAFHDAARRAMRSFANAEAQELLGRAVDAADSLGESMLLAEIQLDRAAVRIALDRCAEADVDLEHVLSIARGHHDQPLEARALEQLSVSRYAARDLHGARRHLERALALPARRPSATLLSARVRHALGEVNAASDDARSALATAMEAGDNEASALARSYLGSIMAHRDDYVSAVELLEEAERYGREAGAFRTTFNSLFFLGLALGNQGHISRGADVFARLLADARETASIHYEVRALNCLAWLRLELGDAEQVLELVGESLTLSGDPALEEAHANGLLLQADATFRAGEAERAVQLAGDAERLGLPAAFGWRFELRLLELRARMATGRDARSAAVALTAAARERGAPKYEALGLALVGQRTKAAAIARKLGSDLLLAKVAPPDEASAAAARLAEGDRGGRAPAAR